MTDDAFSDDDKALVERWYAAERHKFVTPNAIELASYAERQSTETEAAMIEAALARDLALLDDLLAARHPGPVGAASASVIERAQVLVSKPAEIIPFTARRGRSVTGLRAAVVWGAAAASLCLVSLAGFTLGVQTQQSIESPASATPVDLLGQGDGPIG